MGKDVWMLAIVQEGRWRREILKNRKTNSPGKNNWNGLPFPSPEDLPDLRIEPGYPALQEDSLPSEPSRKPIKEISYQ